MTEFTKMARDYKDSIEKISGNEPESEQDLENYIRLINHWIKSKSSGKAYFANIPNGEEVTEAFITQEFSHIHRLVEVRHECKKCEATSPSECPFDKKQREKARDWENEKGLAEGTFSPEQLRSRICVKNCGTPRRANYEWQVHRPELKFYKGDFYPAYGKCPVPGTVI